jgi:hypothetical protein
MWIPGNNTRMTICLDREFQPVGFFFTLDENIYISYDDMRGRVEKWSLNGTKHNVMMNFDVFCYALFVDVNNCVYCSMNYEHRVVKQSVNVDASTNDTLKEILDHPDIYLH